MAEEKKYPLAIVLKADDQASSKLQKVGAEVATFARRFQGLTPHLERVRSGLGKVRDELGGIAKGIGVVGGLAVAAGLGVKKIADDLDDLGDKAERVGVTTNALYGLRKSFEENGASADELDSGLQTFSKTLGQLKAGTGRLKGFLDKVSPSLERQLKGAKSNEEAFNLMADAMAKVKDPAKRAALAAQAFGTAGEALAPGLALGSKKLSEQRTHYIKLAGDQTKAAEVAGQLKQSWNDLGAVSDGLKSKLMQGLGPQLISLTTQLSDWVTSHQADIDRFFSQTLPNGLDELGKVLKAVWNDALKPLLDGVGWLVDKVGGVQNAVELMVGAWVAFKGLKLASALAEVASGLLGIAGAAVKATVATKGLKDAEQAKGGAGGGKGAGLVGSGVFGTALKLAVGATWAGVHYNRQVTGAADEVGLHGLAEHLRGGSGSTTDFADLARQLHERQGLSEAQARKQAARMLGLKAPPMLPSFDSMFKGPRGAEVVNVEGHIREIQSSTSAARVADQRLLEAIEKLAKGALIKVDFTHAPKGTRVETKPGEAKVDTSVGYQLVPW